MKKNACGFELYLNCANPAEAKRLMQQFDCIDGITSNPQMIATQNNGRTDFKNIVLELREACGPDKLLFLQTPSNDYNDIMKDAMALRELGGPNTIIKIPCCADGIKAIRDLYKMGIPTLGTQVLSTMQGVMALQSGAKWIAPFFFPMREFSKDENGVSQVDAKAVFEALVKYREVSGCEGQVLGCAPTTFDELSWMFSTGITSITLDPVDFESPFVAQAFKFINESVQKDWDACFGAGARIHELCK